MRKKTVKKATSTERNKMAERIVKLTLRLRKIRETREKKYDKRVNEEIIKPVQVAAERAFKKCRLGKPKIVVIRSRARQ